MDTKKYIMWSDGVVSSFGELVASEKDTITVKNPVVVVFQVVNEPVFDEKGNVKLDDNGQPIFKSGLKWDMNPYVFGVCLKDSADNVWTITPKSIINMEAEYDSRLVGHYETIIRACDKGQD
jgi:hypothetical protein